MLVGERRIQSTVDRYSPLIPFRAIAGLHLYVSTFYRHWQLFIAAHFKGLLELLTISAAEGLQTE